MPLPMQSVSVSPLVLLQFRKCIVIPGPDVSHGDPDMAPYIIIAFFASSRHLEVNKVNDLAFISWRNPEEIFH